MQQVDRARHTLLEVLTRRRKLALTSFAILLVLTMLALALVRPKYAAYTHVLLVNDAQGRDPDVAGIDMPAIVTSSTVLEATKKQLDLRASITDLRKQVSAKVSPRSSIVTITSRESDPGLAVTIPNAVAENFVKFYSSLAPLREKQITGNLHERLRIQRKELVGLEIRLEEASSGKSYVGSQASLDATAALLGTLREQRAVAYAQYVSDKAQYEAYLGDPSKTAKVVRHEILLNNQLYKSTELAVANDAAQYTTTRAQETDQFPGIAGFRDKVQKEMAALAARRSQALNGPDAYSPSQAGQLVATEHVRSLVDGDEAHVNALDSQISAATNELAATAHGQLSIGALRAQRDVAEAQFNALALRVSDADANSAAQSSVGTAIVVDRAVQAQRDLLVPVALGILGFLVAIGFTISIAFVAEELFPQFINPSDLEAVYGRRVVSTLS